MSCWVVPSVAADLWGVTVDHVLQLIREGAVPHKRDYDFVLVDVAPDSPQAEAANPFKVRPATFIAHSNSHLESILTNEESAMLAAPSTESAEDSMEDDDEIDEPLTPWIRPGELALTETVQEESSWVRVRQIVARRRGRPLSHRKPQVAAV